MEDKKVLNNEELENKEQQLSEDALTKVSGGDIRIRPSDNNQPRRPDDGNLF